MLAKIRDVRIRPVHASAAISVVVAWKAFEMSYAALCGLAVNNKVDPDLASNLPIALEGLTIGAIIATAHFKTKSLAWWYSIGVFLMASIASIVGNVQYAKEIGGGTVAQVLHGGMPVILMLAVHLTLMLREEKQSTVATVEAAQPVMDTVNAPAADLAPEFWTRTAPDGTTEAAHIDSVEAAPAA
ncbi:DUF2637 domain-containing protein [Nocardia terpenica]|uniref:DUF2637 domain-containing protein n=1 Tax=Nocardia terpenica TaxID=455432 RepID=A0A164LA59_9NOCA|nr:DUF2637 domain-containing protein [Nocardia terpenica]KZM72179.1 hypothetical protein AWN90_36495 [Nocardia terpenica]NQE86679.1 DUF2637 domain-containing protein [Nocardia terpenica]